MEILTIILTASAVLFALLYFSLKRNFLQKNGIIHTRGLPLVGHMAPVLLNRISRADMVRSVYDIHKEAKYVGFYDFNTSVIVLRDAELIRSVGVKHFDHFIDHGVFLDAEQEPLFGNMLGAFRGQKWRDIRNILSPSFTSSKMKAMFNLMTECGERFADYLATGSTEKPIMYNSKDLFSRYTIDVIATCAFGIEINSMKNPDNDFYILGKKSTVFEGFVLLKMALMRTFPKLTKILGIHLLDERVEQFFSQLVKDTIDTRDKKGIYRADMIQLMMETRNSKGGTKLTIQEMVSQAFGFFFAGFDTSSSVMCFTAHHIASDPEIQRKIQEEVDAVDEKWNHKLTYEAINNMPYLDALVNEVLRLYVPGTVLDRVCTREFELPPALPGKKTVLLKPGHLIWIPVYALHMDPKYFNDPEKFYPERFIEDPQGTLHSSVYFPFGVGPRMCIANRFALLEIKVVIFHLIRECSLKIGEKMMMPMEIDKSQVTFSPKGGFWLSIQPRRKQNH